MESYLERKQLCDAVKKRGGWCVKLSPFGFTGLPDRLVLLPGGKVLFAETKRPAGQKVFGKSGITHTRDQEPTPRQKWVHMQLTEMGFEVWVVYDGVTLQAFTDRLDQLILLL